MGGENRWLEYGVRKKREKDMGGKTSVFSFNQQVAALSTLSIDLKNFVTRDVDITHCRRGAQNLKKINQQQLEEETTGKLRNVRRGTRYKKGGHIFWVGKSPTRKGRNPTSRKQLRISIAGLRGQDAKQL